MIFQEHLGGEKDPNDSFDAVELPDLEDEVAKKNHLNILRAMMALAAHELSGNRCQKCQMSVMKMGEISSLMLRLQKMSEEADALEDQETARKARQQASENGGQKVSSLADIQARRNRRTGTEDSGLSGYGSKSARRQSPGGYTPRG